MEKFKADYLTRIASASEIMIQYEMFATIQRRRASLLDGDVLSIVDNSNRMNLCFSKI